MAALGNALGDDVLRRAFADRDLERGLRPVIGVERFGAVRPGALTPPGMGAATHPRSFGAGAWHA